MTWDEFVAGWAQAFGGYDIRHAPTPKRQLLRAAHRVAVVLARLGFRPSLPMVISAVASLGVVVLAWRGGPWPAAAALLLLAGLGADVVTAAMAVLSRGPTRLGGFYQSLLDRFGELCWLGAMALLGAHPMLVAACAALVWAHEYVRARSRVGGLGRAGASTIGDRPVRVWLALIGLVLAAAAAQIGQDLAAGVVTMVVFAWGALTAIGTGQLLAIIRKVLA